MSLVLKSMFFLLGASRLALLIYRWQVLSNFPVHKLRVYFFPSRDLRPILWLEKKQSTLQKADFNLSEYERYCEYSVPEYEIRCNYILIYDVRRGRTTTTTNNTAACLSMPIKSHMQRIKASTSNGSCMNSMKLIKPENHCFKTPCSIITRQPSRIT